jgi:hypothetical protein
MKGHQEHILIMRRLATQILLRYNEDAMQEDATKEGTTWTPLSSVCSRRGWPSLHQAVQMKLGPQPQHL